MSKPNGTAPALHTVGSRVWLADSSEGWAKGEVTSIEDGSKLTVRMEDGTERVCTQDEIPLQNPGIRGVEVSFYFQNLHIAQLVEFDDPRPHVLSSNDSN
jgi:hypothetical protein